MRPRGSSRPRAARSGPLPVTQSPSCLAAAVSRASRPVACWQPTELASRWRTDAAWDGSRRHGEPRALQGGALPRGAAGKGAALGGRQGGRWKRPFEFPILSGFAVQDSLLRVSKIGALRLVLHRPIEGTIKTLTLRRVPSGKWYACFSVETDTCPLPEIESAAGIDVGLSSFATLSTGEHITNPHFFRTDEKALTKAQRRLAKASKGTPTRAKCRKVVAHIHERIANRHDNFCHQEARKLVNTHGVLAFEALHIANMMLNSCLAKSIADVAWGQFVRITTDKAACAGRRVAHVDPRYTSQDCSRCGQRVPKSLSQRVHQCPTCQLVMDRDHNAAINILR